MWIYIGRINIDARVTYLKGFVTEAALPASHQSVMKVHIENGVEELPSLLALGEQVALKQLILSRLLLSSL